MKVPKEVLVKFANGATSVTHGDAVYEMVDLTLKNRLGECDTYELIFKHNDQLYGTHFDHYASTSRYANEKPFQFAGDMVECGRIKVVMVPKYEWA